jgi:hypothetical protein
MRNQAKDQVKVGSLWLNLHEMAVVGQGAVAGAIGFAATATDFLDGEIHGLTLLRRGTALDGCRGVDGGFLCRGHVVVECKNFVFS